MIQTIKSVQEYQNALQQPGSMVIDCGAVWCGPCKFIAPKYQELSSHFTETRFYKVDIDEAQELAQNLEIAGVPTFLFFKDGHKVGGFAGANLTQLVSELQSLNTSSESTEPSESTNAVGSKPTNAVEGTGADPTDEVDF